MSLKSDLEQAITTINETQKSIDELNESIDILNKQLEKLEEKENPSEMEQKNIDTIKEKIITQKNDIYNKYLLLNNEIDEKVKLQREYNAQETSKKIQENINKSYDRQREINESIKETITSVDDPEIDPEIVVNDSNIERYGRDGHNGNPDPQNQENFKNAISDAITRSMYYKRNEYEWYTKFHRFGGGFTPSNIFAPTREYVFFVKPDLHLWDVNDSFHLDGSDVSAGNPNPEISDIPYFQDMFDYYPDVLQQLQISHSGDYNTGPFMNLLSSAANSEVDMGSISITDNDGPLTAFGEGIIYAGNSLSEEYNKDFSLEFKDTKYLEVYRLFKTWDLYRNYKQIGSITPTKRSYILQKRLHDQCSAYKIVVGEDGESIIYWAKFWGVYNTSVPRDTFSSAPKDGTLTFTVNFNATFQRDLDPFTLSEFNRLTENIPKTESPITKLTMSGNNIIDSYVNPKWVGCPYIVSDTDNLENRKIYKLKWRE